MGVTWVKANPDKSFVTPVSDFHVLPVVYVGHLVGRLQKGNARHDVYLGGGVDDPF